MIFKTDSTWFTAVIIDLGCILLVGISFFYNFIKRIRNPLFYFIPAALFLLSGVQCSMLQVLWATNITTLISGFGHNINSGIIIISFGILMLSDLCAGGLYYEYNLKMVPAGNYWNRTNFKWLLYLILLILANLGYLYLWREVFGLCLKFYTMHFYIIKTN